MKGKLLLIAVLTLFAFASCESDDPSEDPAPQKSTIDRHSAAEVKFTQLVVGDKTIITEDKIYYSPAGHVTLEQITHDTLPTLPMTVDTLDTGRTREDDNGDEQPVDTMIVHPKSYQFYITVK